MTNREKFKNSLEKIIELNIESHKIVKEKGENSKEGIIETAKIKGRLEAIELFCLEFSTPKEEKLTSDDFLKNLGESLKPVKFNSKTLEYEKI